MVVGEPWFIVGNMPSGGLSPFPCSIFDVHAEVACDVKERRAFSPECAARFNLFKSPFVPGSPIEVVDSRPLIAIANAAIVAEVWALVPYQEMQILMVSELGF